MKRLVSLEAVHPDRYPRPDFTKYTAYKPEAPTEEMEAAVEADLDGQPLDFDIPEPITQFLKLLPVPRKYMGPRLPSEDVFSLLAQLPIPLPVMAPPPVTLPPMPVPAALPATQAVAEPVAAPVPANTLIASDAAPAAKKPRVDPRIAAKRKAAESSDSEIPNKKQG